MHQTLTKFEHVINSPMSQITVFNNLNLIQRSIFIVSIDLGHQSQNLIWKTSQKYIEGEERHNDHPLSRFRYFCNSISSNYNCDFNCQLDFKTYSSHHKYANSTHLPEKKIPSTQAKARILTANDSPLHTNHTQNAITQNAVKRQCH